MNSGTNHSTNNDVQAISDPLESSNRSSQAAQPAVVANWLCHRPAILFPRMASLLIWLSSRVPGTANWKLTFWKHLKYKARSTMCAFDSLGDVGPLLNARLRRTARQQSVRLAV